MSKAQGNEKRRMLLWKLQDLRCAGCGERAHPHIRRGPHRLTVDEVIPRARGGRREYGNQLVMHQHCNFSKADRMPTGCELVWLEMVNARLRKRRKLPADENTMKS
jgi:5-methylcytosine-specific restriction endonuclease McrA